MYVGDETQHTGKELSLFVQLEVSYKFSGIVSGSGTCYLKVTPQRHTEVRGD